MSETSRQWVLKRRPVGMVKPDDFELRSAPVPEPADGELLVRNLWLSFDPTQRGWLEDRQSYMGRMDEAVRELLGWVRAGEIVHEEDVQRGFENIPATLNRLFTGQNLGKQLLQLGEPA